MDELDPPVDWLVGIKDATVSFNLWSTEREFKFFCGCVSEESVAFSLTPPLSHAVEQLACVMLSGVTGSAMTGSLLGTVEEDLVRSSSRQRR